MNFFTFFRLDRSFNYQMGFQDPATPVAEGIIDFHHHIMFFLILILIFVSWNLFRVFYVFCYDLNYGSDKKIKIKEVLPLRNLNHGVTIELIWTIIPTLILIAIAIPSFSMIYASDEVFDAELNIKAIASQWYWKYEYSQAQRGGIEFDSYMLADDEIEFGDFRLLEVDEPMVVPELTHIRLLVTATDVIHAFAVPSLGIKIDAVPGRLNQVMIYLKRVGIFYGQCSEICGVNHGFMPIKVISVPYNKYFEWFNNK